jgi:nucleoside-diphosphate-sugar epimerase
MSQRQKRLLVTGASGFIGRRCLALLRPAGYEIHAVSRSARASEGVAWHACDLLEPRACEQLVERLRPAYLLHLAWIAQPGVFWTSPLNARWLAAGTRLVQAFYGAGGQRAVGCGSCAEYGQSDVPCIEDATPIAPATPYGESKVALLAAWREAAGPNGSWAWARLFFPYGPGEAPGRFIPSVIEGLREGRPVACSHGAQVRDFIHVDDVAAALALLLQGRASGAYNIGTGQGHSLREAAQTIVSQLGHGELVRFGERAAPEHDYPFIVADPGRMRRDFAWSAKLSLDQGIRRTLAEANSALPERHENHH